MMGGASGGFRDTDSATANSARACLLLFVLVFAGGVVVGVGLILIGAGISATLSGSGRWLVPPRPSLRFWLCVGLVLTVAARSRGASGLGAGATRRRAGAWQRTQRPRVPPLKRRRASRPGTARRAGAPPPLPPPPPSRSIPPAAAPRSAWHAQGNRA